MRLVLCLTFCFFVAVNAGHCWCGQGLTVKADALRGCPTGCMYVEDTVSVKVGASATTVDVSGANPQTIADYLQGWHTIQQCVANTAASTNPGSVWFNKYNDAINSLATQNVQTTDLATKQWVYDSWTELQNSGLKVDLNSPTCFTQQPPQSGSGCTIPSGFCTWQWPGSQCCAYPLYSCVSNQCK